MKILALAFLSFLLKVVVLHWATQKMVSILDWIITKLLADKPEEVAIWLHFRKKRAGLGHNYPNPLRCNDEGCASVQLH